MLPARNITRWRERELFLVALLCILAVVGNCWRLFQHSAATLNSSYGEAFVREGLPFNYATNVLLPNITVALLICFCYFWMNLFILPRLLQTEVTTPGYFRFHFAQSGRIEISGSAGQALKRFFWGLSHTFLLILCLGTGWGIADFYSNRYLLPRDISDIMIMGNGLRMAINLTGAYIIYAMIREAVVRRLETDGELKASRIAIINQASAWLTGYFAVCGLLIYFDLIDPAVSVFCLGILLPATIVVFSNLYWLFPLKGDSSIFRRRIIWRLLLSTLIASIPLGFMIPDRHAIPPSIISLWLALVTVITPLSWLIYRQQKDKILQIRGLETELGQSKADLQFLRSQINPHFLFNVLNTLYGTALHEHAGKTAGGIQQLGDMMRFMLHENNLDRIAMSKEVEYVKNYISLQQLRTEASSPAITAPSITIDTQIEEDFPDCNIAPMLIIPFVENAFKHGISLREPSWIYLVLNCDGQRIQIEIRNSVHTRQGADPEKGKSGVGLKNVLRRLKLIYPDRHEFFMHQDEREFFVQLTIQL